MVTDPIVGWATQFVVMLPPSLKRLSEFTESNQSFRNGPPRRFAVFALQ